MNSIIVVVGMPGSGKTEVCNIFKKKGFTYLRFGDITMVELNKKGLKVNEKNERRVRESLRKKYGMGAYAKIIIPKIRKELKQKSVIADGLYSWEEYIEFKKAFGTRFSLLAVYASPKTRIKRLIKRTIRSLSPTQLKSRDRAEIENLNKGGPIAMADYTIVNEGDLKSLKKVVESVWQRIQKN